MTVEPPLICREGATYNCRPDRCHGDLDRGVRRETLGTACWKQILTSSIIDECDELMTKLASETIILTILDSDGFPPVP
jgi:hypothetical protein